MSSDNIEVKHWQTQYKIMTFAFGVCVIVIFILLFFINARC
jgi:hypothetical protein